MNKSDIMKYLEDLGIKPLKSLGQNFLVDSNIINKICSYDDLNLFDYILEIGPGLGSLTQNLEPYKEKLKLIELDRKLAEKWEEKGYKVFHQDALKFNWKLEGPLKEEKSLLISNLPYQISSRLLVELFCQDVKFNSMILMFQKEVGDRLRALPEDKKIYGLISVLGQLCWNIKTVTKAPRSAFFPSPEIESVVLSFKPKSGFNLENPKEFVNFLKALFSARRKKISGTVKKLGYTIDLGSLGDKRPDHLNPEELYDLFIRLKA